MDWHLRHYLLVTSDSTLRACTQEVHLAAPETQFALSGFCDQNMCSIRVSCSGGAAALQGGALPYSRGNGQTPATYRPTLATFHSLPELLRCMVTMSTSTWQEIAAKKQAQRDALIPPRWRIDVSKYQSRANLLNVPVECGVLSDRQVDITSNYDAVDLLAQMRNASFSVEEVVTAFCARAAIAQQLVGGHLLCLRASS